MFHKEKLKYITRGQAGLLAVWRALGSLGFALGDYR